MTVNANANGTVESPLGPLRIVSRGGSWTVEANWLGGMRAVFTADPSHHPLIQIVDCILYRNDVITKG